MLVYQRVLLFIAEITLLVDTQSQFRSLMVQIPLKCSCLMVNNPMKFPLIQGVPNLCLLVYKSHEYCSYIPINQNVNQGIRQLSYIGGLTLYNYLWYSSLMIMQLHSCWSNMNKPLLSMYIYIYVHSIHNIHNIHNINIMFSQPVLYSHLYP